MAKTMKEPLFLAEKMREAINIPDKGGEIREELIPYWREYMAQNPGLNVSFSSFVRIVILEGARALKERTPATLGDKQRTGTLRK